MINTKPTKTGGLLLIFATEESREAAFVTLLASSRLATRYRIVRPQPNKFQILVFSAPWDLDPQRALQILFSPMNPKFQYRPDLQEKVTVFKVKQGLVFKGTLPFYRLALAPPAYIHFGPDLHLPVVPYIPLFLCFRCSTFGHQAKECTARPICVRCGESGHQVKDCSAPDIAANHQCANCRRHNEISTNRKLPTNHPAYHLKRCQVASSYRQARLCAEKLKQQFWLFSSSASLPYLQ